MTVPDYQSCLLPLLLLTRDGQEHSLDEAIEELARGFSLSDEDRNEMLQSGREATFDNRVGWAKTYLKKAGLLEYTGRKKFRITQRGKEILGRNLTKIDVRFLNQFPEFLEFRQRTNKQDTTNSPSQRQPSLIFDGAIDEAEPRQTPQEVLEASHQSLRRTLTDDILERVKASSPRFFERLVVDLLVAMGYGGSRQDAGQAIGKSGDEGIDGIIKEDKLGLDVVYVQAKKWEGTVGRPTVQGFAGSLEGQRARKGVFIVTSQFSKEAREYVGRIEKKIVLIDGEELAQLMIDYNVGVAEEETYVIKKVDADYFGDE